MTDLKILYVQKMLCSRASKEAATLLDAGVELSLIEMDQPSPMIDYAPFAHHVNLPYPSDIVSLVRNRRAIMREVAAQIRALQPDIVHTHNGPDCFGAWLPSVTSAPVVHDIHDLQTVTAAKWPTDGRFGRLPGYAVERLVAKWERQSTTRPAGVFATSPLTAGHVRDRYGAGQVFAIENKAVKGPMNRLPKLSDEDGEIHIVYGGGITPVAGGPRDLLPAFQRIAEDGVHVHFYMVSFNEAYRQAVAERVAGNPRLHLHGPVPQDRFIEEISQYDYGIIWLTTRNSNIRMTSHNKQYEFQIAGLPIVTNQANGFLADYIRRRGCGVIVRGPENVAPAVRAAGAFQLDPSDCFMEAHDILSAYETVLAAG